MRCVNCHATHSLPVLECVWKPLYEVLSPSITSIAGSKLPLFFASCFSSSSLFTFSSSGVSSNPTLASVFGGINSCSCACKASACVFNASAVCSTSCKMSVNAVCCSSVACSTDAAITFAVRAPRIPRDRYQAGRTIRIGHRQCNTKSILASRVDYGRNSLLTLPSGYCPEWWWFVPTSCTGRQISTSFASSVRLAIPNDAFIVRRLRLNNLSVFCKRPVWVVAILPLALKLHRFSRSDRIVHLARCWAADVIALLR